jgi:Zn-dependent M28 family amino/carboxypeptidase
MSVRMRAAFVGAILTLVLAPAAEAAKSKKKLGDFRLVSLKVSKKTVTAGSTVVASGRVQNRKGRRAQTARVTYTLRKGKKAKSGRRLGSDNIKRTKAGKFRRYSERLRIASTVKPGTYYLTACVRRGSGTLAAECARKQLKVKAKPTLPTAPGTPGTPGTPADNRSVGKRLADGITFDGMFKHLQAFQNIANANGGNRASGFPGHDASGQYVIDQLTAAGYSPVKQPFDFVVFQENTFPVFQRTAPGATVTYEPLDDDTPDDAQFATMSYSASGDVTQTLDLVPNVTVGPPASDGPGCQSEDFAGISGQVALIQRGGCAFALKALNAQTAGALAAVIYNNIDGQLNGTLGEASQDGKNGDDITIPVVGTLKSVGEELAAEDATGDDVSVHVKVDATNSQRTSFNVLADTPTGSDNVIVVGSHLDSRIEGPGINDNGTGSAFNLELALQMAKQNIKPDNKVRFAFWGAEESGLVGATRYVQAISDEEFAKIRMNLNYDMLGSPNFARFILDGDFSSTNGQGPTSAPALNPGAAEIEKKFESAFDSAGLAHEPTAFDGRSDYKPFQDNGVAAGGLFTGAEVKKTTAQRDKFGGIAGVAFDPNYHQAGDDLGNVSREGYEQMTDAAAFVTGSYATDRGMPARFQQIDPTPRRAPKRSPRRLGSAYAG